MIAYLDAKMMPLEKAFPNFLTGGGIFDELDFDWLPDATTKISCNMDYYLNRSGRKMASPLVARYVNPETGALDSSAIESLAHVITMRFGVKWNRVWHEFSSQSSFINNVETTVTVDYGKSVSRQTTDNLTKSGTEKDTVKMEETVEDDYTGQSPRTTTRTITGGYTDTTEGKDTRTGSQKVTDKGSVQDSVYGFNSSTAVPSSVHGPLNEQVGTTQETTYGDGSEGSGLIDSTKTSTTRVYGNSETGTVYTDSVSETGKKKTKTSYGVDGKTIEKSFTARTDSRSGSNSETHSGADTTSESGYRYNRATDKLAMIQALFNDPSINDFFEVVYADIDSVLTCPIFV